MDAETASMASTAVCASEQAEAAQKVCAERAVWSCIVVRAIVHASFLLRCSDFSAADGIFQVINFIKLSPGPAKKLGDSAGNRPDRRRGCRAGRWCSSADGFEGGLEVGEDVVDVLGADGQADGIGADALVGERLLGQLAVQFCRAAGCAPVIAVDPIAERRAYAEKMGADYTFDPFAPDFVENVKKVTDGKGVNVAVEVTGNGKALDQVLDCMARFGRVSLLGCTRNSDFTIDYYRKIHFPGITLVGAHTAARPDRESAPGYWCYDDDLYAIFKLLKGGRLHFKDMIAETHLPEEAPEVYTRLVNEKNFPLVVQFDWTKMN